MRQPGGRAISLLATRAVEIPTYLLSVLIENVHSVTVARAFWVDKRDSEQYLARVSNHSEHLRGKLPCPPRSQLAAE